MREHDHQLVQEGEQQKVLDNKRTQISEEMAPSFVHQWLWLIGLFLHIFSVIPYSFYFIHTYKDIDQWNHKILLTVGLMLTVLAAILTLPIVLMKYAISFKDKMEKSVTFCVCKLIYVEGILINASIFAILLIQRNMDGAKPANETLYYACVTAAFGKLIYSIIEIIYFIEHFNYPYRTVKSR